jgi:hypothetical protein
VETIGTLEDWYGVRHLAIGRCWQLKKRTQGDGGSRRSLPLTEDSWPAVT